MVTFKCKYGLNDYIEYKHESGITFYCGRIVAVKFDLGGAVLYDVDYRNCAGSVVPEEDVVGKLTLVKETT